MTMRNAVLFFIAIFLTICANAAPAFKSGSKYHIVVSAHSGGCIADGKSAGQETPLYYLQTATTDNYTYWLIDEVSSGQYSGVVV